MGNRKQNRMPFPTRAIETLRSSSWKPKSVSFVVCHVVQKCMMLILVYCVYFNVKIHVRGLSFHETIKCIFAG